MSPELVLEVAAALNITLERLPEWSNGRMPWTYGRGANRSVVFRAPSREVRRRWIHHVLFWGAGHSVAPYPDHDCWPMPTGFDVVIVDPFEQTGTHQ